MADDVAKKLEGLRQQAAVKLRDAQTIIAQMNAVESLFEFPLTTLASLADLDPGLVAPGPPTSTAPPSGAEARNQVQTQKRRTGASIRPDEYFGLEPLEASKAFMRGVGHAVHFDEITDAVQKGGAAIKGADWKERLEISLKRSPYQVITVAEKTYGLADFYTEEQLKRFRSSRRSENAGKKKTKKPSAKRSEPATVRVHPKRKARAAAAEPTPRDSASDGASEPVH